MIELTEEETIKFIEAIKHYNKFGRWLPLEHIQLVNDLYERDEQSNNDN